MTLRQRFAALAVASAGVLLLMIAGLTLTSVGPVPDPTSSGALVNCPSIPPGVTVGDSCGSGSPFPTVPTASSSGFPAPSVSKPSSSAATPSAPADNEGTEPDGDGPGTLYIPGVSTCIHRGDQSKSWWNVPARYKEGTNAFGPPVLMRDGNDGAVLSTVLLTRMCQKAEFTPNGQTYGPDRPLLKALYATLNPGFDPNAPLDFVPWQAYADAFWGKNLDPNTFTLEWRNPEPGTMTLDMKERSGQDPLIRLVPASQTEREPFLVVNAVAADGEHVVVLWLRLKCGFQPYFWPGTPVPANV